MKIEEMQHIPLATAFLCADCASVGNSSSWCPACSSTHVQSLANVLDRQLRVRDAEGKDIPSVHPHD